MEKPHIFFFVTLVIYLIAVLFFLCGFGGPNWLDKGSVNVGLFKQCVGSHCQNIKLGDTEGWFKATVAMMILAFLTMIAAGISFLWMPVTTVCHFVTGGFVFLAIIVFGAEYDDRLDLGWAYALAILSSLLFLANGGIMAFLAMKSGCDMTRRPLPCLRGNGPGPA